MATDGHHAGFTLFTVPIAAPSLDVVSQRVVEQILGESPGGPTYNYYVRVRNRGTAVADSASIRIENQTGATVTTAEATVGTLDPGEEAESGQLRFKAANLGNVRLRVIRKNTFTTGDRGVLSKTQTDVDVVAPSAPTNVCARSAAGSILLRWSGVSGVAGYNVYRAIEGIGGYERVNDSLVAGSTLFFDTFEMGPPYYDQVPYDYYVKAVDSSWNESSASGTVSATAWLAELTGWPKQIDVGTEGSVLVEDIDGDGDKEIMLGGRAVFAWHHDGTELVDGDNDPNTDGVFYEYIPEEGEDLQEGRRFMTDFAAIPGELVVGVSWDSRVYFWEPDGTPLPNTPITLNYTTTFANPAIADLDANGSPEILVSTAIGTLYSWTFGNGQLSAYKAPVTLSPGGYGGVAVGDITSVGGSHLEVVYATNHITPSTQARVYLLNDQLQTIAGWPFIVTGTALGHPSTPTIDDIDNDGSPEIAIAYVDEVQVYDKNMVTVIDVNQSGQPSQYAGWPARVPFIGQYGRLPRPLVADIRGSADREVIIGESYSPSDPTNVVVHVFNRDGSDSDPLRLPVFRGYQDISLKQSGVKTTCAIVDADGDGIDEVVYGTDLHEVALWNTPTNTLEPGWPITLRESIRGEIRIVDLENDDSANEVVVSDLAGWIHVWDYLDLAGRQAPTQTELRAVSTRDWLGAVRPNPLNASASIPYGLGSSGEVRLVIYNALGRVVRDLVRTHRDPGMYMAIWDVRNNSGGLVPSGVYFYELRINGASMGVEKFLVVR